MKLGPDIPTIDGDEVDAFCRRLRGRICGKSARQKRFAKRKYQRRSRAIAKTQLKNVEPIAANENDTNNVWID